MLFVALVMYCLRTQQGKVALVSLWPTWEHRTQKPFSKDQLRAQKSLLVL